MKLNLYVIDSSTKETLYIKDYIKKVNEKLLTKEECDETLPFLDLGVDYISFEWIAPRFIDLSSWHLTGWSADYDYRNGYFIKSLKEKAINKKDGENIFLINPVLNKHDRGAFYHFLTADKQFRYYSSSATNIIGMIKECDDDASILMISDQRELIEQYSDIAYNARMYNNGVNELIPYLYMSPCINLKPYSFSSSLVSAISDNKRWEYIQELRNKKEKKLIKE